MVTARARELPAGEREQDRDRDSRKPKVAPFSLPPNPDGRCGLQLLLLREAAVVLVDEPLRVEPEVVRVGAEESLRVAVPGKMSNRSSSSAMRYRARIRVARSTSASSSFWRIRASRRLLPISNTCDS
jgi:hypothetical protein